MQSDSDKFSTISQLERHWRSEIFLKASDLVSFGSCSTGEVDTFLCYILYAALTPAALTTAMPSMFMRLLE